MRHTWAILLLFALGSTGLSAQYVVSGIVQHSVEGSGIGYVNIGIPHLMRGTVSDSVGKFDLNYASPEDTVYLSAIGFQKKKVQVADLISDSMVSLEPDIYELGEISVIEKGLEKSRELGFNIKKRRQSIGFGSTQLGTEIGALIEIDRETMIHSAHFIFNRVGSDSLLFRVNLYEMGTNEPLRNLLPENVLFMAPDTVGIKSVDLTDYALITDNDVLITLEWVDAVSVGDGKLQDISFRADRVRRNPNAWFRTTSHTPFKEMKEFVSYRLGFYLVGQQISK